MNRADKSLTKPPGYYLTGYEGSPCERIEPEIIKWKEDSKPIIAMDFGKGDETVCVEVTARPDGEIESIRGIDTDEFKKQCEEVERQHE